MATAAVTYTFANGTNADGTQVNANFTSVVNFLNTETIQRDASIAFTSIPSLPAVDPTTDNQAVRKAYVDNFMPAGVITQYGGSSAPTGWLLCQGQAISRSNPLYARLWSAISTTYGAGDGSTTFNVPNLQGKFPVGKDATQSEFDVLAETGGAKTHTLTTANMPSHQHGVGTILPSSIADHIHGVGTIAAAGTDLGSHTHIQNQHSHTVSTTTSTDGGHTHTDASIYFGGWVARLTTYATYSIPQHANAGADPMGTIYVSGNAGSGHSHTSTGTAASTTPTNQPTALGSHLHAMSGSVALGGGHTHTMTGSTALEGSGTAVTHLPPYVVVNYIIKL